MENLIKEIDLNKDNPEVLSMLLLELSSELYYHNTKMAEAELSEKTAALNYVLEGAVMGEKRAIGMGEMVGIKETNNEYGKLKAQGDAISEIINSIKTRIKVLIGEKDLSKS